MRATITLRGKEYEVTYGIHEDPEVNFIGVSWGFIGMTTESSGAMKITEEEHKAIEQQLIDAHYDSLSSDDMADLLE